MCGFPVYSNGQRTISLRFDNSVQERDGAILFVVLYCKPYDRVNTVDVLKEALFVGFLVDDKGVIYIPAPELGGYSMYKLATMGLTGEPMAAPSTCSQNWPRKEKYVFLRQNSKRRIMSSTSITVLSLRVLSLTNRSLMMLRAGSMGTGVNKTDTS